jgi:hypothetical protein
MWSQAADAAGEELAEGAQAPRVSVGLMVVRHGGRRARCLYPCISAMETLVFRIGGSGGSKYPLGGQKRGLFSVARTGHKFRRFHDGRGGCFSFVPVERDAVGQWELQPTSSPWNRRLMFGRHRRKAVRRRTRLSRACTGVWASAGAMPQDDSDA